MVVRVSASAMTDQGRPSYMIAHVEDVTGRRLAEQKLARRALYDPVTGLPNRHLCLDHLRLALDRLQRDAGMVAVLYLDLDRFKDTNDTRGHQAGDLVLEQVGRRLTEIVRAPDTAARFGGDEFVVVAQVANRSAAVGIADRLQRALQANEITIEGTSIRASASIGIAVTDTPMPPDELLRRADSAMYGSRSRR